MRALIEDRMLTLSHGNGAELLGRGAIAVHVALCRQGIAGGRTDEAERLFPIFIAPTRPSRM